MKKIKIITTITIFLFLGIVNVFSSSNIVGPYDSLTECSKVREENNNKGGGYKSYKRSECYINNGKYEYLICLESDSSCKKEKEYKKNTPNKYKDKKITIRGKTIKLNSIKKNVSKLIKNKKGNTSDLNKQISNLKIFLNRVVSLGNIDKWKENDLIQNLVGYISFEIEKEIGILKDKVTQKENEDTLNEFICELKGNCDSVNNTNSNTTNSSSTNSSNISSNINDTGSNNTNSSKTNWKTYSNHTRGKISKSGNKVLLNANGGVGFILLSNDGKKDWGDSKNNSISFNIKTKSNFGMFIAVETKKGGRTLYYKPIDENHGNKGIYTRIGLGKNINKGNLETIKRNLEEDIKNYEPDNKFISINNLQILSFGGNIEISNLLLENNNPNFNITTNITNNTINNNYNSNSNNYSNSTNINENEESNDIASNNNYNDNGTYTPSSNSKFGAREVKHTDLSKGTYFISPNGSGTECSKSNPCSFDSLTFGNKERIYNHFLMKKLVPGDVVFFRGGTYNFKKGSQGNMTITPKGTKNKPIIFESYPGEKAIIDGTLITDRSGYKNVSGSYYTRIKISGEYIKFRKIEVKNGTHNGIDIKGNNNIVEGCTVHHNDMSGIDIGDGIRVDNNIVRDNIIYRNSDEKYSKTERNGSNNGGNADGIVFHTIGNGNKALNNTIYENSDDGIDVYGSSNSEIAYNIIYKNGRGLKGNGNGIKLLVKKYGSMQYVHHNIVFKNNTDGITAHNYNSNRIEYNTIYHDKTKTNPIHTDYKDIITGGYNGLYVNKSTVAVNNMISGNFVRIYHTIEQPSIVKHDTKDCKFINITDFDSKDFFRPVNNGFCEKFGVYAK